MPDEFLSKELGLWWILNFSLESLKNEMTWIEQFSERMNYCRH